MIATTLAVRDRTRHGVSAPWRVDYILAILCSENNCLPNRLFRNMEVAETLGFMAAVYEGFSEPPGIRMPVRGVGGQVIIETGGMAGAPRRCGPLP